MVTRRCCCGKVEVEEDCVASIINDYQHEPLGPKGNFCGPRYRHEMRDLNLALERRKTSIDKLVAQLTPELAQTAGEEFVLGVLPDVLRALVRWRKAYEVAEEWATLERFQEVQDAREALLALSKNFA